MNRDNGNGRESRGLLQRMASPVKPFVSRFKGPRVSESWEEVLREIVSHYKRLTPKKQPGRSSRDRRGPGLRVLLAGEGSREKGLLAASIARDLGQEIYQVDVGDLMEENAGDIQEKLKRLFEAAQEINCLLLLDNLDSLLGERAGNGTDEQPAALDIHALMESMQNHPGLVVLAVSRDAASIDDSLASRMDFILPLSGPDTVWTFD